MDTKLLSPEQKKEAEFILVNYKKAFCCKKCGVIFGSDYDDENGHCPLCLKKENLKCGRKKSD